MTTGVCYFTKEHNLMGSQDLAAFVEASDISTRMGHIFTNQVILVNAGKQLLHLMDHGAWSGSYTISTAKNGMGSQEGSEKTPHGLHCVVEKIGDGAAPLAVFSKRKPTGEIATPQDLVERIVGRILRLDGLEDGKNRGGDVDSFNRYIYIHGTNRLEELGSPKSRGCVRMDPEGVIDLFNTVHEDALVYIYGSPDQKIFGA